MNKDILNQIDLINDAFFDVYKKDYRYKEHDRNKLMHLFFDIRNEYGWYFKGKIVIHLLFGGSQGVVLGYIETSYYTHDYYLSVDFEHGIETCTAKSLTYVD